MVLFDLDTGEIANIVYSVFDDDVAPPDDGQDQGAGDAQGGNYQQGGDQTQGPPDDASAAAQALNQGDFKSAKLLFTRAIESGQLSNDDLESAYVGRGMAEQQSNAPDHARRDADAALRLKPGDPDAVALWNNTKVEVAPAGPDPTDGSMIVYACSSLTRPDTPGRLVYEVDAQKNWVRVRGGAAEAGRKLDFQVNGSVISWYQHEETNNGYADQYMTLDTSSGAMSDTYSTSGGVHGITRWMCQTGG
jgi:tetratricopeptide (TPR) repeat protein